MKRLFWKSPLGKLLNWCLRLIGWTGDNLA